MVAHDSVEKLLQAYPSITPEDIAACLDYAASLVEEQARADLLPTREVEQEVLDILDDHESPSR